MAQDDSGQHPSNLLKIRGTPEPEPGRSALRSKMVAVRAEFRPATARATRQGAEVEEPLADDDVLEIEFAGGHCLWMRVDDYRRQFAPPAARDASSPAVLAVPDELPLSAPEPAARGPAGWALKSLKVLGIDPAAALTDKLAGPLAEHLARQIEERRSDRRPGPGLFSCRMETAGFRLDPLPAPATGDRPWLLLIHGIASSTWGSFGDLWSEARRGELEALRRSYDSRVIAFEHASLTRSPIENAIQLAELLPDRARLHLLTFSRGGLVGELLCRAARTLPVKQTEGAQETVVQRPQPFAAEEFQLFEGDAGQLERLRTLDGLLKAKQFTVERAVRVACPALGTTFASRRLDRWLSVIGSLAGTAIEGTPLADVLDVIGDFMAAVVKERTNPARLAGLEAMMPESAFIRLVNWPSTLVPGDLAVIAGDVDPQAWWGRLLVWVTDRFYEGDHDLIVNTVSMLGGTRRTGNARVSFHRGPQVHHFSYFQNPDSAQRIVQALTAADGELPGFEPIDAPVVEIPREAEPRSAAPQPVVFVLPGIMGTELEVQGNRIWLDLLDIFEGQFDRLHIGAAHVVPLRPFERYYGALIRHLSRTHTVIPFPFDWRLPIEAEADRLAERMAGAADDALRRRRPVRILAHSMGGLVARAMIARHDALWKKICAVEGARLVMLGTPNGGSHSITELLLGQAGVLKQLALLDQRHSRKELLQLISRFPGALAMLPAFGSRDFFSHATWQAFQQAAGEGWVLPEEPALKQAAEFRALLDRSPVNPEHLRYVAGCAPATIVDTVLDPDAPEPGERIRFKATARGDGRVPWDSGIPQGVKTWYLADVEHGDLPAHEDAFEALTELLEHGETERLPQSPPVARSVTAVFDMPRAVDETFPDEERLAAAVLGGSPRRRRRRPRSERTVAVRVVHGNLMFARHPVAVGHYAGDTIISAERSLDRALDGMLSRRNRLGIYPGALGTSAVFINPRLRANPSASPRGAIVVGLGTVGSLNASALIQSMGRALLEYVTEWREFAIDPAAGEAGKGSVDFGVSALLIGTGAGGMPVSDSVFALLEAVKSANRALAFAQQVERIRELEIIELWQDQAIQAVKALRLLAAQESIRSGFDIDGGLHPSDSGLSRVSYEEPPGWWQRLQVLGKGRDGEPGDGILRFAASTRRARAEVRLLPTQQALVDQFIAQSIRTTADNRTVARTLYELLMPTEIKEQASTQNDLVLLLDEESARFPWELLDDRWSQGERPLFVENGLLRQLESTEFRNSIRGVTEPTALVIGDPVSRYPELKGAQTEAEAVSRELSGPGGFQVEKRIRPDSRQVIHALYGRAYRVLHLAGHGVYRQIPKQAEDCRACGQKLPDAQLAGQSRSVQPVTGMIIGDDAVLSPQEVRQMRFVPELVFINCCHLGYIEPGDRRTPPERNERDDYNRLAANVATEFIRMGVRAVIAAGWAVVDTAAETFATTFYRQMLQGQPFGRAVKAARRETFDQHPSTNTWGAFQCYGDPDYRLVREDIGGPDRAGFEWASPAEAAAELNNAALRFKTSAGENATAEQKRLRAMARRLKQKKWLAQGGISAALGRAFGEARALDRAIRYFQKALCAEDGQMTLKDIEQLANFQAREAARRMKVEDPAALLPDIDQAIHLLEMVMGLAPGLGPQPSPASGPSPARTGERLALLGSCHKRKAWISASGREAALAQMARFYQNAFDLARDQGRFDAYPLLNWITAELCLAWQEGRPEAPPDIASDRRQRLNRAREELDRVIQQEKNFWTVVMRVDAELLQAFYEGELSARQVGLLAEKYRDAALLGSEREFASVLDQIDFLTAMAGSRKQVAKTLRSLRRRLDAAAAR
jgi:tetratricopeptide (TPR) repeat protein/pimeloyl-ACP methyl ester carboxylesterase